MEKMEQYPHKEKPRAYSKGELARKYLPNIHPVSARRTFCSWIEYNDELKAELEKVKYRKSSIVLTPAQVAIIFKYLGEP